MYYTIRLLSDSISKTRNVFLNEVLEMQGNPDRITGIIQYSSAQTNAVRAFLFQPRPWIYLQAHF